MPSNCHSLELIKSSTFCTHQLKALLTLLIIGLLIITTDGNSASTSMSVTDENSYDRQQEILDELTTYAGGHASNYINGYDMVRQPNFSVDSIDRCKYHFEMSQVLYKKGAEPILYMKDSFKVNFRDLDPALSKVDRGNSSMVRYYCSDEKECVQGGWEAYFDTTDWKPYKQYKNEEEEDVLDQFWIRPPTASMADTVRDLVNELITECTGKSATPDNELQLDPIDISPQDSSETKSDNNSQTDNDIESNGFDLQAHLELSSTEFNDRYRIGILAIDDAIITRNIHLRLKTKIAVSKSNTKELKIAASRNDANVKLIVRLLNKDTLSDDEHDRLAKEFKKIYSSILDKMNYHMQLKLYLLKIMSSSKNAFKSIEAREQWVTKHTKKIVKYQSGMNEVKELLSNI